MLCLTDTLVITTLDRLGRSPQNMLAFADALRSRGAGSRILNLGGGDVDTATPMGSMLFTRRLPASAPEDRHMAPSITDIGSFRADSCHVSSSIEGPSRMFPCIDS